MRVEVFSDVVCPWCAVGKRRFEQALARFDHADEVEVVWRSYELDPRAPAVREGDYLERLAAKYGMTREQATAANERLTSMAAAEGLRFRFDRVRPGNTFDAHRLLHHARDAGAGMQDALKDRLFTAYFTEGEAIGERKTLVRLAGEVGLDTRECAAVLAGDRYGDEVRTDEAEAAELGVTGVPFFVVGGSFGIPGAQDAETMVAVLHKAWDRSHPRESAPSPPMEAAGEACDGDTCAV